jgi:hypothetical protein
MANYTTKELVRTALQKIGDTNVDDSYLDTACFSATSDCDLYSGKDNWQTGDKYFGTIQGCALQLAKAYAIATLNDKEVTQDKEYNQAIARLERLRSELLELGIITTAEIIGGTEGTTSTTWPNNPQGEEIIAVYPEVRPLRSTDKVAID